MPRALLIPIVALCLAGQGCATSSSVKTGALYGAVSGVVVGAGIGYAISDEHILGSDTGGPHGDTSLAPAQAILSGALIGATFGGIIGAMVGHKMERPNDIYLERARRQQEQAAQATPRAF